MRGAIRRKALDESSLRVVTFDVYAIQRPSGENRPLASLKAVCMNGIGLRSPESGSTKTSPLLVMPAASYRRYCPSRDQSVGYLGRPDFNSASSSPAPLDSRWYRFSSPSRVDPNAM